VLLDELQAALREAAADQPAVADCLDRVVAGGRRRRRRSRAVLGALVVMMFTSGVLAVRLVDDTAKVATVNQPSMPGPIDAGTPCSGSVLRRADGGNPGADALPPLEDASTDRAAAEQVLFDASPGLLVRDGTSRVELGAGFGRAWVSDPQSPVGYRVVDTNDYGILVEVTDTDACPRGPQLWETAGVPLFYFIRPDEPSPPVDADGRIAMTITAAVRGGGHVEVTFHSTPTIAPGSDRVIVKWTIESAARSPIRAWVGYAIEGLPAACDQLQSRRWESLTADITAGNPPIYPSYNLNPGDQSRAASLDIIPAACAGDYTLVLLTISDSYTTQLALQRVPLHIGSA
jgi:hypothetical protein